MYIAELEKKTCLTFPGIDDLLTWSQQLFCHGHNEHANILTCNSRAKSDRYIQASKRTEISPPNSLVWGSLRLAPITLCYGHCRVVSLLSSHSQLALCFVSANFFSSWYVRLALKKTFVEMPSQHTVIHSACSFR